MSTFTRKDYLAAYHYVPGQESPEHRRYYGQLVNSATISAVVRHIGADRLKASTDPHFNDIPLREWDLLAPWLPTEGTFRDLEDFPTKAGFVCVAKEAARQYVEGGA